MYREGPAVLDNSVEHLLNEYRARQHWERREYLNALTAATAAADYARGNGDQQGYWRMALLKAECQMELGLMQDFAKDAKNLIEDPKIAHDPITKARATALYARALQCLGQVGESLKVAKEAAAIELAECGGSASGNFDTHQALIASLADSGKMDEAWEVAQSLLLLITSETPRETAGLAYWAVGNVAFLMKKGDEGTKWHAEAALCLSPSNDVYLWAQFNKASAHVRIWAHFLEPATLECIERAELAISVSGGSPMDELEIALVRAHWQLLNGEVEDALRSLELVLKEREILPPPVLAEAEQLMALALFEVGRIDEALNAAQRSEKMFMDEGALRMSELSREVIDRIDARNS